MSHMRGRSKNIGERHSSSISREAKNTTKERFCTSGDCPAAIMSRIRRLTVESGRRGDR